MLFPALDAAAAERSIEGRAGDEGEAATAAAKGLLRALVVELAAAAVAAGVLPLPLPLSGELDSERGIGAEDDALPPIWMERRGRIIWLVLR